MNKIKSILIVGLAMFSLTLGSVALASDPVTPAAQTATTNLDLIGGNLPGGADTNRQLLLNQIARIITTIIGFLGVIALIMVIYAGFLWMTSGGADEKAKQARTLMINGAVGLLIILAAYSITSFVFNALLTSVTGTPGS